MTVIRATTLVAFFEKICLRNGNYHATATYSQVSNAILFAKFEKIYGKLLFLIERGLKVRMAKCHTWVYHQVYPCHFFGKVTLYSLAKNDNGKGKKQTLVWITLCFFKIGIWYDQKKSALRL